jgi:hypothetical protein
MKKTRTLSLMLFLLIPSLAFAQTSRSVNATANKSWQTFWRQFSAAVNKKDRAALKGLMVSEKDFDTGGAGGTRDDAIQELDRLHGWRDLQKSIASGTEPSRFGKGQSRITKDQRLLFDFIGGRWRFRGYMGD